MVFWLSSYEPVTNNITRGEVRVRIPVVATQSQFGDRRESLI